MKFDFAGHTYSFTPWKPEHGRQFDFFAYDTETTPIDDERPYITPNYVIGAACDGTGGVFITRDQVGAFFKAHEGVPFTCHNASFDLRVTNMVLRPTIDIYDAVDRNLVWDTMILKRLHSLATVGHTARGEAKLEQCAKEFLGVDLEKLQVDSEGNTVRTNFGLFLGRPPSEIPEVYLRYLATDAIVTSHVYKILQHKIVDVLQGASSYFGFVDSQWLADVYQRFGPLTHHIQLQSAIVMDAITANGIGIDQIRRDQKLQQVQAVLDACRERLRRRGYMPGEKGCGKALQSILADFHRNNTEVEMHCTPTDGKWSAAKEHLGELAAYDAFFGDYIIFRQAEKLVSTYVSKMGQSRLHAKFRFLVASGRTSCGGGFNLQNLPKENDLLSGSPEAATIRGCFVPGNGDGRHVFIDADYSQIELVALGYVWKHQLRLGKTLHDLINADNDLHRLIAAAVLDKELCQVTKQERNSAKPVSFGRPGGMGAATLQKIARLSYGLDLSADEIEERIAAYHRLCPEMDRHLNDEVNTGLVIASQLNMSPWEYNHAIGRDFVADTHANHEPTGWLGGMLLKVLREAEPRINGGEGRAYTSEEIDFYWTKAQLLPLALSPELSAQLESRTASVALWKAVRDWAGRRSAFTVTGRLRANTTFCSARNNLFQGTAADGAILGLWKIWRAGYQIAAFVHDQVVVEVLADERMPHQKADIERLMIEGMTTVLPGTLVKVESAVRRSLSKADTVDLS